jgi:hypothetical protein
VAHEPAPERGYSPPEPRPDPVEADFVRSAPSNDWSPQEHSFSEAPRESDSGGRAAQAEPSAPATSDEPAPVRSDERQTG